MGNIMTAAHSDMLAYLHMNFDYLFDPHPPHSQLLYRQHAGRGLSFPADVLEEFRVRLAIGQRLDVLPE